MARKKTTKAETEAKAEVLDEVKVEGQMPKAEEQVTEPETVQTEEQVATWEPTTTGIIELGDIMDRIAETVSENTESIRKMSKESSTRLKVTETSIKNINKMIEDITNGTKKYYSIIEDVDKRLTSLEEKEQTTKKSVNDSIHRINNRIVALEQPKSACIEIMPLFPDKKLVIPTPSKDGSIGDDLVLTEDVWVAHGRNIISLNIRINIPRGIEGKIEPRSGFSARGILGRGIKYVSDKILWFLHKPAVEVEFTDNMDADVINGKIDPGYHDGIGIILKNHGIPFMIPAGTRLAQITYYKTVAHRYKVVEEFSDKAPYVGNRKGGFGSSNVEASANAGETGARR